MRFGLSVIRTWLLGSPSNRIEEVFTDIAIDQRLEATTEFFDWLAARPVECELFAPPTVGMSDSSLLAFYQYRSQLAIHVFAVRRWTANDAESKKLERFSCLLSGLITLISAYAEPTPALVEAALVDLKIDVICKPYLHLIPESLRSTDSIIRFGPNWGEASKEQLQEPMLSASPKTVEHSMQNALPFRREDLRRRGNIFGLAKRLLNAFLRPQK